jgi:hypothetical protein
MAQEESPSRILSETLIPLRKFPKIFPLSSGYRQILRYARSGVRIGDQVIRLETARLPKGLATSIPAYKRFITTLNAAEQGVQPDETKS